MTVEVETNLATAIGNGATTVFDYNFRIPDGGATNYYEVYLLELATADRTDLVEGVDFTIDGIGNENGGSVTYPLSGAPLASTHRIVIERIVSYTQELDIASTDGFNPEVVEAQLDLMVMQTQQVAERLERTPRVPVGTTEADYESLVGDIIRLTDSVDNVDAVADSITAVNTVAANITDVQNAEENATAAINAANAAQTSETNAAASATAAASSADEAAATLASSLKKADNLSDLPDKPAARTNLGLGTAAVLDAGNASGNLKALNADGGFSFNTAATPSIDIAGAFGGVWKTTHRFRSTESGAGNDGTFATVAIIREAEGLATMSEAFSNVALWVESTKKDWLTSTAEGQTVGAYIVTRHGRRSDGGGGLLIDQRRVRDGDYVGSMLGIELASNVVDETNTILSGQQVYMSWQMGPSTGNLFPDGRIGFGTEPRVGDTDAAFAAVERSDLPGSPSFVWAYLATTERNQAGIYAALTGSAHPAGAGFWRVSDGAASTPSYSFLSDPDTGMYLNGLGDLAFVTAGVNRMRINSAGCVLVGTGLANTGVGTVNVQNAIHVNNTKVIDDQGAAVADASGGATIDAEARTAINSLLARVRAHGLIAS